MKTNYSTANQNLQSFECTMPSTMIVIPLLCVHGKLHRSKKRNQNHLLQRFSTECRKTKTKSISLANHKRHRQYSEPIKIRSNNM